MRPTFLGLLLLATASSPFLSAASISYTGSLTHDNDVKLITLNVPTASTVTFRSLSYAGGVNAAGTVIPSGGFDVVLDLFNSAGALIDENDDGTPTQVPADPVTLQNFDFYLQTPLTAGTYTVAIEQFDNFANGPTLSGGFYESSPNFTSAFGCSNGMFCDVTGANRTGNWAFDVSGISSVATPEPSAGYLLLSGFGVLTLLARRKLS